MVTKVGRVRGSADVPAGEGYSARDEIRDDGTLTCHNTLLPDEGDTDQWVTGMSTPDGLF